jgi:hypothetical protein
MSDTRDEAYRIFLESGQAGEAAKAVFSEIFKRGDEGATCFEIEEALGMKHETASGRITPLRSKHALIYYDGTTRVNPEPAGGSPLCGRSTLSSTTMGPPA